MLSAYLVFSCKANSSDWSYQISFIWSSPLNLTTSAPAFSTLLIKYILFKERYTRYTIHKKNHVSLRPTKWTYIELLLICEIALCFKIYAHHADSVWCEHHSFEHAQTTAKHCHIYIYIESYSICTAISTHMMVSKTKPRSNMSGVENKYICGWGGYKGNCDMHSTRERSFLTELWHILSTSSSSPFAWQHLKLHFIFWLLWNFPTSFSSFYIFCSCECLLMCLHICADEMMVWGAFLCISAIFVRLFFLGFSTWSQNVEKYLRWVCDMWLALCADGCLRSPANSKHTNVFVMTFAWCVFWADKFQKLIYAVCWGKCMAMAGCGKCHIGRCEECVLHGWCWRLSAEQWLERNAVFIIRCIGFKK